LFLSW